ncbi:cation:proton antiporter [Phenylobacterium sp. Root77]|jgi:multicomponent K+:H+ antiporter subunit F|uniref:K+/H+ antiporter subunit F n=1 Tax=unclassified Phenylobacterium TaxID=2640670 RepID=UPI0007008FE2|nr:MULTISPECIES: K+/H+ antiporter subunit F [unclassified Phenylobacterium]KQW66963.1 cation:proton antiporter [Phenylobacterium sp. Root1277]KQW89656.1 cation:proton antiporter [Phenylobacterium sp. Root1290]KRC43475.1 cation:proton antiporter [Phenylobacterium sp. Root77]
MTPAMLLVALQVSQVMLALAMACAVWRMWIGPRSEDQILALDTLYVNALLFMITIGITTGSPHYFEVCLVIALLGFAGTVALARFLLRGEVIE